LAEPEKTKAQQNPAVAVAINPATNLDKLFRVP
jgi:hypothetical protein